MVSEGLSVYKYIFRLTYHFGKLKKIKEKRNCASFYLPIMAKLSPQAKRIRTIMVTLPVMAATSCE